MGWLEWIIHEMLPHTNGLISGKFYLPKQEHRNNFITCKDCYTVMACWMYDCQWGIIHGLWLAVVIPCGIGCSECRLVMPTGPVHSELVAVHCVWLNVTSEPIFRRPLTDHPSLVQLWMQLGMCKKTVKQSRSMTCEGHFVHMALSVWEYELANNKGTNRLTSSQSHRQRSGSTLAQVIAWCHQAPSHYLNLCWLLSELLCHSP